MMPVHADLVTYALLCSAICSNSLILSVKFAVRFILCLVQELLKLGGGPAIAPPTQDVRTIELTVDGMGCEACEAHVRGVLDRAGGVVSSQVNFEAGKATVMVAKDWGFALDSVSSELAVDGYDITDTVVVGDKGSSASNDDDDSQSSVVEAPRQQQPAKNEHKVKVEANGGGMGSRHSVMIDSAGSEL